jgi:bifunctional enzyme CysN/CysC
MNALTSLQVETAPGDQTTRTGLRIVVVGHVDHGKSTLIGRLIHDTGSLEDGKLEAIKIMSERRGMPFEWAFLLDALQAERDQGITIDTSQIRFRTPNRDVVLIDAPGHVEFLKNMVTGAAQADAALLVVDAEEGVREQSRRHGLLLKLLGVSQVSVVVNKMDKVGFSEAAFRSVETELGAYLHDLGVTPRGFIPAAARSGDMIAERGDALGWYSGPTIVETVDRQEPASPPRDLPLRLVVQDIYKFDDRRIVAGRVESGRLSVGDELAFLPSGKLARVRTIETWPAHADAKTIESIDAGRSVGITLDREIFIERGEVAALRLARPSVARALQSRVFWLGDEPLSPETRLTLKLGTAQVQAKVASIDAVVDSGSLQSIGAEQVERNQVADVTFSLLGSIAADSHATNPRIGRFVLETGGRIRGGGVVINPFEEARRRSSPNVTPVASAVSEVERIAVTGHRGSVVWLTGLPSSGKSTVGHALERTLFDRGVRVVFLDGDTLRTGLNGDLGFTVADRSENVRRTAEMASFLARQGQIAIVALVSPLAKDRALAREIAGRAFVEVHVHASVATCAARDPKGLYAKARAGEIKGFTGVSAPYEMPERPDILLETDSRTLPDSVTQVIRYLEEQDVLNTGASTAGPVI